MLKQIKLQNAIKRKNIELEQLITKKQERQEKIEMLKRAIEEAKTEDEAEEVNKSIEDLEKEFPDDLDDKIEDIKAEITEINNQLEDIENKYNKQKDNEENEKEERNKNMTNINKLQTREALKTGNYYERAEVKEFYEGVKNIRALNGGDLLIPEIVINRIMDIVGDYSTLYKLVDKVRIGGKGRIILDTDDTEATWLEMGGTIGATDVGTLTKVDFDGFKVGKGVLISNELINESIINLDDYITKKIGRALAKAIDKAILNGEGASAKQPEGILTKLTGDRKVNAPCNDLEAIVKNIGLIDTGENKVGEIVALMKRSTYYNKVLGFSINVDSNGNVVGKLPNIKNPDLLGLRVEFSQYMEEDKILFGDFEKYTLVERGDITINESKEYKFFEDQTAYLGKGVFDGKITDEKGFALVTLTESEVLQVDSKTIKELEKTIKTKQKLIEQLDKEIEEKQAINNEQIENSEQTEA